MSKSVLPVGGERVVKVEKILNPIVWRNLVDSAKNLDVKFWNIQNAICKTGSVLAHTLHDLNAVNEEEPNKFGSRLLDRDIRFLGHANAILIFRRQEVDVIRSETVKRFWSFVFDKCQVHGSVVWGSVVH